MNTKHILFVEDEARAIDLFESAVVKWNKASQRDKKCFESTTCLDLASSEKVLYRTKFDCALFDLRIPNGASKRATAEGGNKLAIAALEGNGIPIAIMSGNVAEVDEQLLKIESVKVFDKGDGDAYEHAIEWFAEQWDMMDILFASRKAIESHSAEIFVKRLWPRWASYSGLANVNRQSLTGIVTRQYVSHMADLLGIDDPTKNVTWHPFENYISPALMSERAHTGDIFELEDGLWIVLSPQCDMATKKIKNVLMAKCDKGITDWAANLAKLKGEASAKEKKSSTDFFRKHVNQNLSQSKHFLPPLPDEESPLLVDFSHVHVVSLDALNLKLDDRKSSVSAPFLSNLIQRFGAYMSRTGQPNIDINHF